jgi:hypothetical protein
MRYKKPLIFNMTNYNGPSFFGLLFLCLLVLKLTGFIDDWTWWYVTAPLWLPLAILFGILALFIITWCITAIVLWAIGH